MAAMREAVRPMKEAIQGWLAQPAPDSEERFPQAKKTVKAKKDIVVATAKGCVWRGHRG